MHVDLGEGAEGKEEEKKRKRRRRGREGGEGKRERERERRRRRRRRRRRWGVIEIGIKLIAKTTCRVKGDLMHREDNNAGFFNVFFLCRTPSISTHMTKA